MTKIIGIALVAWSLVASGAEPTLDLGNGVSMK